MPLRSLLHISLAGINPDLDASRFDGIEGGGDVSVWFENRLKELGLSQAVHLRSVHVFEGEALPEPESADAVVLGGSYRSIYEGLPWQSEVMAWLESYRGTGRPLLGICGGHQMVSMLGGARVEPFEDGPLVGSLPVTLSEAGRRHFLFDGFPDRPEFHFGNSDHVLAAPEDSVVLASSGGLEVDALDFGGQWVTVQFHPEASHELIAREFVQTHPDFVARFHPVPDAPKVVVNFLKGTGVID